MDATPGSMRRLVNEVRDDGTLAIRIETRAVRPLAPGELLIRVEAAPLHPTDLGQLLLAGDLAQATRDGDALVLPLNPAARPALAGRVGRTNPLGTEGAGTVIAVGDAADDELIGRRIATHVGGLFADHRILRRDDAVLLPAGTEARDAAAAWVNPLTALAMVETMRADGGAALVHTAAASSLGQILLRVCQADGVPLVAIVRSAEQAALLRAAGAVHVLDSSAPDFLPRLIDALVETNATIGFDAVGGGPLAGMILTAMEQAQQRRSGDPGFYGSPVTKRVYVYGRLDLSPAIVPPTTGMAWNLGGFLLMPFLDRAGPDVARRLQQRVVDELRTTFAIRYTDEVALDALLDPAVLRRANAKATGAKHLVRPHG